MMRMLLAAAALAAVTYATSYAAKSPAPRAPVRAESGAAEEGRMSAEVVRVNQMTRTVTFKDDKGEKMKVRLPRDAANLEQLKPGAKVTVRYVKASAVAIGRMGATPGAEEDAVTAAPADSGRELARNRMVVGRVENVDLDRRELKILGPDDEIITLNVARGVAGLEDVKPGDSAAIRFTEAVAVSVAP